MQATELASPRLQEVFDQQAQLTTMADLEGAGDSFDVQVYKNHCPSLQARLPYTWMQDVLEIQQVSNAWERWLGMGLQSYSSNAAPIIHLPQNLKAQTSQKVYNNFTNLMPGKESLRDIAARLNRDIWSIAQVLQPLIHQQIIGLVDILDLSLFSSQQAMSEPMRTPDNSKQTSDNKELIACIDNSPQTQKMIETIVQASGYNFLGLMKVWKPFPP